MKGPRCHPARTPQCPGGILTRREFLKCATASAALLGLSTGSLKADRDEVTRRVRRAPTAIGLCKRYQFDSVRRTLAQMFDQLGTIRRLVKGKHVTIKTNLVNTSNEDVS